MVEGIFSLANASPQQIDKEKGRKIREKN